MIACGDSSVEKGISRWSDARSDVWKKIWTLSDDIRYVVWKTLQAAGKWCASYVERVRWKYYDYMSERMKKNAIEARRRAGDNRKIAKEAFVSVIKSQCWYRRKDGCDS